jgi:hypothetical protein
MRAVAAYYQLRALDANGQEIQQSRRVRTQPRFVEDLTVSVIDAKRVELKWQAPPGDSPLRYHAERAVVEVLSEDQLKRLKAQTPPLESPSLGAIRRIGPFERITTEPVTETSLTDTSIDLNHAVSIEATAIEERKFDSEQLDDAGRAYRHAVYAYRVRAVNALDQLGGPSPAVLTVPSSPQFVLAKEDGAACHLKWQANPESGVRGYRVYRMNGRFGKDATERLTSDPLTELSFTDLAAGKDARRYYVVAVDALGQEGFPSSPAWSNREWKTFYVPFVGEWHQ